MVSEVVMNDVIILLNVNDVLVGVRVTHSHGLLIS